MDEHPSYHGSITSEEAKRRLQMWGGLCYLTRFSKSNQRYMLSVYQDKLDIIKHFRLLIDRDRNYAQIQGKRQSFKNIDRLLHHYEYERISPAFRSIGIPYREARYVRDEEKERLEGLQRESRRKKCTIL